MVAYHEEENTGKKAILLLMAPFIGLFYVIALPFISIATLAAMVGRKLAGLLFSLLGNLVSFSWRPGEAYLGGKKKKTDRKKGEYPNDS